MKTAQTIEEQEARKQARGDGQTSPANTRPAREKLPRRDPNRIAAWRWQPGQSGNPSGRPKHDLAAEIARAVLENNSEAVYKAFSKALLRGNAYCFQVLADRGYGKLKEHVAVSTDPYRDMSAEDLKKYMRELETKLGVPHAEPEEEAPPLISEGCNSKPN